MGALENILGKSTMFFYSKWIGLNKVNCLDIWKKSYSQKEWREQAAQGGDGVTIPGGVQETCRYISEGHGLLSKVVLG